MLVCPGSHGLRTKEFSQCGSCCPGPYSTVARSRTFYLFYVYCIIWSGCLYCIVCGNWGVFWLFQTSYRATLRLQLTTEHRRLEGAVAAVVLPPVRHLHPRESPLLPRPNHTTPNTNHIILVLTSDNFYSIVPPSSPLLPSSCRPPTLVAHPKLSRCTALSVCS